MSQFRLYRFDMSHWVPHASDPWLYAWEHESVVSRTVLRATGFDDHQIWSTNHNVQAFLNSGKSIQLMYKQHGVTNAANDVIVYPTDYVDAINPTGEQQLERIRFLIDAADDQSDVAMFIVRENTAIQMIYGHTINLSGIRGIIHDTDTLSHLHYGKWQPIQYANFKVKWEAFVPEVFTVIVDDGYLETLDGSGYTMEMFSLRIFDKSVVSRLIQLDSGVDIKDAAGKIDRPSSLAGFNENPLSGTFN